jgi:excisionase family DNA binding protein
MAGTHHLSVREAARLLEVGVSTVKRWADNGIITSFRTVGGHRRFARHEVERVRASRLAASSGSDRLDVLAESDSLVLAAELLRARARLGSWCAVADETGQLLEELGQRWERGQISVLEEHLASERLARALLWCENGLPTPSDGPICLLATAEGDDHTLGLSLAELCCREAGWSVRWAGRRTPLAEVATAIGSGEVQMVALSASRASTDAELLRRNYETVAAAARPADVAVVLGGEGPWPEQPPYGHRLRGFEAFNRLLVRLASAADATDL